MARVGIKMGRKTKVEKLADYTKCENGLVALMAWMEDQGTEADIEECRHFLEANPEYTKALKRDRNFIPIE